MSTISCATKRQQKTDKLRFPTRLPCVEDRGKEIFLNTKRQITLKFLSLLITAGKLSELNPIQDPKTSNVKLTSPSSWRPALWKYSCRIKDLPSQQINEQQFGRTCIYLWQISSSATFDYCSIHARPLVSRAHPPGICHDRVLYRLPKNNVLQRSSGAVVTFSLANVLQGRQYSNRL